ncbi:Cytochrome P450 [Pyrenophora teres f. maculata]|nr:Cytochrome P450 [Pyrenophora teres f. maculata]
MSTTQDSSSHLLALATPLNILLSLGVYITCRVLYQIIYYRSFHPLRHFPGPFWASVTRLWMIAYHNIKADECEIELALQRKYGPVLRITSTLLLVSDATKLPEVYNRQSNKLNHYITGSFSATESLFNMRERKHHAHFRKIAAGPYSFTNVKKMEGLVDLRIEQWVDRLDGMFRDGKKFDFAPWVCLYLAVYVAYDIISEIGFGAPIGFIERGSDIDGLIQGFHDGLPAFGLMARLWPFTDWAKRRGQVKSISLRNQKTILSGGSSGREARQSGFAAEVPGCEDGRWKALDLEYIKAEMLLVLFAGADTTGTTFQAMIAYIASNSRVFTRLMEDIDSVSGDGKLSPMPQYDEVMEHCPYYIACVKETMRLCPSAPTISPRLVGAAGMHLRGRYAPPGTEVTCNPWLVHRDENVHGPDACEFRPER